jgi:ABC-type glycerol-3-phosphate transport system substrate-binding protein
MHLLDGDGRRLSRRQVMVAGGAAGLYVLTGCGGDGSSGTATSQSGETAKLAKQLKDPLTVLTDFDYIGSPGSMNRYWKGALRDFESARGIDSETSFVAYANLGPKLESNHAARQGPVIEPWYANLHSYRFIFQDALEPLDNWIDRKEMDNWKAVGKRFDGKLYYCPFVGSSLHMVYNREHLDKAGVDPEQLSESWEAFIAAADEIKAAGIPPVMLGGADYGHELSVILPSILEVAEDPVQIAEWQVGDLPIDEPVISLWMDHMEEWREGGYINEDAADTTQQQAGERFAKGEGALWNSLEGPIFELDADRYGIAAFWKGPGPLSAPMCYASSGMVMTSYQSDEAKAAGAELMKFIHTQEQMDKFRDTTSTFPTDERYDIKPRSSLEAASLEMLETADPEPWWPTEYMHGDVLFNGWYPYGQKILAGRSASDVREEFDGYMENWRKRNPQLVTMLNEFIGAVAAS